MTNPKKTGHATSVVLPAEFSHGIIPAQKCALFPHHAHASKLRHSLEAIRRSWLPGSGHEIARPVARASDFFERYAEGFDPRTAMGDIEVWIPVKS